MRAISGRPALASSAPVVFLVVSLCLIAVLAWQAVASAAGHRALAHRVLRDYADLAAIELIRRGSTFLFTYGFDVATQALTRAPIVGSLPPRDAVAAALPGQSRRAMELVGDIVRVNVAGRRFESSGEVPSAEVQLHLFQILSGHPPASAPSRVITLTIERRTRIFAFADVGADASGEVDHLGFEVPRDAIAAWLREFVLREPLLPPALASREIVESALSMDVRLSDGSSLLQSAGQQRREYVTASRPWSDEASRRRLLDFTVVSGIEPSAASTLIIGGLPTSRLDLLFALSLLATALVVMAVVQLRRDRALTAMRQDFVTRTSHELRTPVARIRIFTDTLLLDRVRTDDERREAVHAIDRAARRLSLLVENVLQFSRMDARDVGHHLEATDLVAFVRDVAQEFETTVGGARVVVSDAPVSAYADIDREAVRQALLNVLDNAWKYGGADRPIRVTVAPFDGSQGSPEHGRGAPAPGEIRIRVSDSGPGVPEPDRARIWEPYVRLDRDRRSSVAGTGIGLAVVRDIVHRHSGTAWVETADAGGVVFVLALPAANPVVDPSRSLA